MVLPPGEEISKAQPLFGTAEVGKDCICRCTQAQDCASVKWYIDPNLVDRRQNHFKAQDGAILACLFWKEECDAS